MSGKADSERISQTKSDILGDKTPSRETHGTKEEQEERASPLPSMSFAHLVKPLNIFTITPNDSMKVF